MKRVILTGASGFVGANLVRRLLKDGHDIHLLVRQGYNPWRIEDLCADVQLHVIELTDDVALNRVVGNIRPDWVFHLATYGAYSWQTDLHQMIQTNIIGSINLIMAGLRTGFEVFVNTGSSSEHGFKRHASSETDWLEPNSLYAVTKASATLFCQYFAQSQKMRMSTLRLYSVYGPYEEPGRLMPTLILLGLQGKLPPLVNPSVVRDYVYVEDVVDAYIRVATQIDQEPGAIYNVGTGIQTSMCEVVEIARRVMGIVVEPKWGSMMNRLWDTSIWVADSRKIRHDLGWQPSYTFEQGFCQMVSWFLSDPKIMGYYRNRLATL